MSELQPADPLYCKGADPLTIGEADELFVADETDPNSIGHLELTRRAHSCLLRENILTIGQLAALSDLDLMRIPNLGRLTLRVIREALAQYFLNRRDIS